MNSTRHTNFFTATAGGTCYGAPRDWFADRRGGRDGVIAGPGGWLVVDRLLEIVVV